MTNPAGKAPSTAKAAFIGAVFFLVVLVGGLLLGTASSLTLTRNANGQVTAVNAWRLGGRLTLLTRSVEGLRDARVQAVRLTESERRSNANRDFFGQLVVPEELLLVGTTTVSYPYREDLSLIRAFLKNPRATSSVVRHPIDIRRQVASWVLLTFAALIVVGWIVRLVLGRDPLAGAPDRVTPLPAPVGAILLLAVFVALMWFFNYGHRVFGPEATSKVDLLMTSAARDDAEGIRTAGRRGVFVDIRDGQGMTALMIAARSDAPRAANALLELGANPGLRDINDNTPLMWAISMGKARAVERLLEAPIDTEAVDANGRGPLYLAAGGGESWWVSRLLQAGARPDDLDAHGWTPLMTAAAYGSTENVRLLLAAGANPNRKLPDGRSVLDLAANGDVRALVSAGAVR